ncbi:chromosomal replication initiator protein DnaA [Pelobacter seleniigenes]|uniref:chromosomal replication initiator protein DnaA n=1 Tax=Pelobacter seleniigenes TaxID=407188 RepID=UPI0004A71455|nr:chromosomal replication initiator protein DnaA [Pelobacter seleniigenes]
MKNIWEKAVDKLKSKISDQNINTWIKPIQTKEISDDHIILEVPNKFIKDWVKENYNQIICETLYEISKINFNIEIQINRNLKNKEVKTPKEPLEETVKNVDNKSKNEFFEISNINPNYTFKTFVSGPSNQFAHAAALAVSNNPATTYNPLFIYGGVGLGKTHIIHAIGNEVLKKNNNIKVCYYSSEKFTNELINSLRHAKMDEFRNKFRSIDILLIDDIQFIAGKKSTQEEFFHTFNALYESHKQIVVTSDKFPKEIPDLEERLRSRFEWGLIADIQSPDTETKQAILKMKADQNKIDLPEDVAYFLANSITSNVRELEGYLIRVGAYASLTSTPINLNMAKTILKDIIIENSKEITIEKIQKTVAEHFQIKSIELKSSKRLKNLVLPRQIAMYICRKLTDLSYPEIGTKFGGKDHSTIIHAIKKIDKKMEEDLHTRMTVEKLMEKMGS